MTQHEDPKIIQIIPAPNRMYVEYSSHRDFSKVEAEDRVFCLALYNNGSIIPQVYYLGEYLDDHSHKMLSEDGKDLNYHRLVIRD